MSAHATALEGVSTGGAGERALAAATRAIKRARRAGDSAYGGGVSSRQPAVDFTSLGLAGWNRHGAQSLFRLAEGGAVFTGGRDVARRSTDEGPESVVVNVMREGAGAPQAMPAAQLLALSDGVVANVLSYDRRQGAAAPGLRAENVPAVLVPLAGVILRDGIGLALGGEPESTPLEVALEGLGLAWASLDGTAAPHPQETAVGKAKTAELDEVWLLGGAGQQATWRRLASLRALGVHLGDDTPLTVARAAEFLAGVADAAAEAGHVALALSAAAQEAAQTGEGALVVTGDDAQRGLAAAGRDCAAATTAVLDALGAEGEAEVAAGAYRLRATLGASAGAAARGAMAACALSRGALVRDDPRSPPSQLAARHGARRTVGPATPPSASRGTAPTADVGGESPFSMEIRRLTEARDAARAARAAAAAAGGRALGFSAAAPPRTEASAVGGGRAASTEPPLRRQRVAPQLAELRPLGAEDLDAAQVLRRVEAELGGSARASTELARAAGRGEALHLLSPDSRPAVRAAAEDWDSLLRGAGGAEAVWGARAPPAGWAEAADRLMALLLSASAQGARRAGAVGAGGGQPAGAARTLPLEGELPAAATSKLVALKTDAGEAGRRVADAAVLEPLTTPAVQRREWLAEPARGPVPALARMTAEASYGDAVWAAVYSNGKYTGTLAAEGVIPTAVVAARQQLVVLLRSRVEDAIGPDRLPEVREGVRALVEAVLTVDLELELVVKLLGGRRPSATETRASTYEGVLRGGRWGSTKAATAAIDVPTAMMALGELPGMAHVLAGNGTGGGVVAFGLVELAQLACGPDELLPLDRGLALIKDVFVRLRHEGEMRRTRPGWPLLDIGAIVRRVIDRDFADAQRVDQVARAARAASKDIAGGGGPRGASQPSGTAPHGGPGAKPTSKPQAKPHAGAAPAPAPAPTAQPVGRMAHQPPPPPTPAQPPVDPHTGQPQRGRFDSGFMRDGEGTPAERAAAHKLGMRNPPTLAPLSIGAKVAGAGVQERVGAIEALEYLALLSDADADKHTFPCPWVALFKSCRKSSAGGCKHCAQAGTKPHPPGAVARVRAASSARLQGFIPA